MKKFVFIENAILLRFNLFKMIIKGVISICVGDENVLIQRMMKRDNMYSSVSPCIKHPDKPFTSISCLIFTIFHENTITVPILQRGKLPTRM